MKLNTYEILAGGTLKNYELDSPYYGTSVVSLHSNYSSYIIKASDYDTARTLFSFVSDLNIITCTLKGT